MTTHPNRRLIIAGMASLVAAPALAHHDRTIGSLTIVHPWSRATPEGARVGGGYMTIRNAGAAPDRLVAGTMEQAGRVEIHEMAMQNGVMVMREVAGGIVIPARGEVELKPGGFHVMFLELKRALVRDETLRGTLTFASAGTVEVTYAVGALGAGPDAGHGAHGLPVN